MRDTLKPNQPLPVVRTPIVGVLGDDDRVTFHDQVQEFAETPAHLLTPGAVRILDPKA